MELDGRHSGVVSFFGYIAHSWATHGHIPVLTYGKAHTTGACHYSEADFDRGLRP